MVKEDNNNLDKYKIRTDLAVEDSIKAKKMKIENINGIEVSKIVITEEEAKNIDKKPGVYYTIDTRAIQTHDNDDLEKCENVLAAVIKSIMKLEKINSKKSGLIVGLGNINVTPDSLGPLVVDNVIVTRHLFLLNPQKVSKGVSEISAIAPGVMGTTGIETYDIIEAIIKKVDIDYMIVVDALASRAIERVNKTIQVTNTGIKPGSGVGNKRKEISKEAMGIPVIAIGVPTVVDAVTITSDTIDLITNYFEKVANEEVAKELFGHVGILNEENKRKLIDEILTPKGFNMMVTPKEVDLDVSDLTQVISRAIDKAVHPIITQNEV